MVFLIRFVFKLKVSCLLYRGKKLIFIFVIEMVGNIIFVIVIINVIIVGFIVM